VNCISLIHRSHVRYPWQSPCKRVFSTPETRDKRTSGSFIRNISIACKTLTPAIICILLSVYAQFWHDVAKISYVGHTESLSRCRLSATQDLHVVIHTSKDNLWLQISICPQIIVWSQVLAPVGRPLYTILSHKDCLRIPRASLQSVFKASSVYGCARVVPNLCGRHMDPGSCRVLAESSAHRRFKDPYNYCGRYRDPLEMRTIKGRFRDGPIL
jgi:hypothetical protein